MLPVKTILHPIDFSENSELAFQSACALARDYGARLVVAHVSLPPTTGYGEAMPVLPPRDLGPLRDKLRELRPSDPNLPVAHVLLEGDPITEVPRLAKEVQADLIVMGTHGRRGLRRVLFGSVAEGIMRRAGCAVLTVKRPAAADIGTTIEKESDGGPARPSDSDKRVGAAITGLEAAGYRNRLEALLQRLDHDRAELKDEVLRPGGGEASGGLSDVPVHPSDISGHEYEEEVTIGLIESEEQIIDEINHALQRIKHGTYGRCEACGEPIARQRLEAVPYARLCITCARQDEASPAS